MSGGRCDVRPACGGRRDRQAAVSRWGGHSGGARRHRGGHGNRERGREAEPPGITAQRALFAELGAAIGGHRRFLGFDLSNEIHWFTLPFGIAVPTATGDAWLRTMFDAANRAAPGKLHVAGMDHYPWLNDD